MSDQPVDQHNQAPPRSSPTDTRETGSYVTPKTYLQRPSRQPEEPLSHADRDQRRGLKAIRHFLKIRNSYDVLPLSFRLIVLDNKLSVEQSLEILLQNAIVSAPLWESDTSKFAGLLTTSDYINVIQYYWQNPEKLSEVDRFKLSSLRDIEKAIGVSPIETVSCHPDRPLYEACRRMLSSRARRIPLVDVDDETGKEMVVSVITQYRILKFIAVNVVDTQLLRKPVSEIGLGTYSNIQTGTMDTPVIDIIHMMVEANISSIPIVDDEMRVINIFEAVDVIPLIKGGAYDELSTVVGDALEKRPADFGGMYVCTEHDRLEAIFEAIRKSRVHRLTVIDDENRLKGVISLSDILKYILLEGADYDDDE